MFLHRVVFNFTHFRCADLVFLLSLELTVLGACSCTVLTLSKKLLIMRPVLTHTVGHFQEEGNR